MTLSALLYGEGGSGKSFIGPGTSPGPVLVGDTEGGAHKLPRNAKEWDISSGSYPDTTTDSMFYVPVNSAADLDRIITALHTPESPFVSFWLDSVTVYVKIVEDEVFGAVASKDQRQDYKALLKRVEPQMITLNHLAGRADRKLEVVGVTAWQRDDKVAPQMAGSIARYFNHTFDLTGHITITFETGKLGQVMHIMPTRGFVAKAPGYLYNKSGEQIVNPNFAELNEELKQNVN